MRAAFLALLHTCAAASPFPFPYLDPSLSIPARTANLLSLLTVEEKVSLLNAGAPAIPRLQLPAYSIARECERGDTSGPSGTTFPSGAALAATFNPDLIFQVARLTALEARANANSGGNGGASCFGPVVNFVHDSRWGRTNEMLTGEDSALGAVLGAAFVRGLQSWTSATPQGERLAVTSTVKHLLSYSGPEGRGFTFGPEAQRFSFLANFSSQSAWREFFFPAFRATAKAGARGMCVPRSPNGFPLQLPPPPSSPQTPHPRNPPPPHAQHFGRMCSYSAFSTPDGYQTNSPACGSPELLTQILRKDWGYDGFVLSDAGAVVFIGTTYIGGVKLGHGAVANASASAIRALEAGCDVELTCCGAQAVFPTLADSVAENRLAEATLDTALARVLKNRFELGELDPAGTYPWQSWAAPGNVTTPEMVALSADAAAQAIVLLKNDAGLLPLSPLAYAGRSIAVIGPLASDPYAVLGGYGNTHPPFISTFAEGLQEAFPLSPVLLDPACPTPACPAYNASALALAARAEVAVVVLALGTTSFYRPGANNESGGCGCPLGNSIEAECCDRTDTALPGAQLALLQALAALGKPLVLVLNSGGALDVEWARASPAVPAMLHAPFLGMSAGVGLGRVLTGQQNPSARTTLTWYQNLARDLPPLSDYSDDSLYARTYRYTRAPLSFPFAYGLSYTQFRYATLSAAPSAPRACDAITLTVQVENTGARDGVETVLAFGTLRNSTALRTPRTQLLAFAKVFVPAQGSARAVLVIPPEAHAVLGESAGLPLLVQPGLIALRVAGSSDPDSYPGSSGAGLTGSVTVVGPAVPLSECSGR